MVHQGDTNFHWLIYYKSSKFTIYDSFDSLEELVDYYSKNKIKDAPCVLGAPCPKPSLPSLEAVKGTSAPTTRAENLREEKEKSNFIPAEDLELGRPLGSGNFGINSPF